MADTTQTIFLIRTLTKILAASACTIGFFGKTIAAMTGNLPEIFEVKKLSSQNNGY